MDTRKSMEHFYHLAEAGHHLYQTNDDLAYVESSFAEENVFLRKLKDRDPVPSYEGSKALLPELVWDGHADTVACYHAAWKLAFSNLHAAQECEGMVSNFIDTAFNGCLFMWDSSFITMFGKYGARAFDFQKTLDNFYACQHMDGFICRELSEQKRGDQYHRFDPVSTGPNILAWAEWQSYLVTGDLKRIEAVFPPLLAYHLWLKEYRTWPDGSYWTTGWGCGMDNQPRQQQGAHPEFQHGHMVWADACIQQILNARILIRMAHLLGRDTDTDILRDEAEMLTNVVNNKLWNDADAFYYDLWPNGQQNKVKSIGAYWALLAGIVPPDRVDDFIAHLENPKEFNRPHPVPTLSADHPMYDENAGYWLGGVWSPTNYMVLKGLEKYGKEKLANNIAQKHIKAVSSVFAQTGTLWENYAPEHIQQGIPAKKNFVGWTGLSPIAIVIENVFGIRSDAQHKSITWRIANQERHGVLRYPFCGKMADLICPAHAPGEKPALEIHSELPLTVKAIWPDGEVTIREVNV